LRQELAGLSAAECAAPARRDLPAGAIQSITIIDRLWDEFSDRMNEELDWAALRANGEGTAGHRPDHPDHPGSGW
jgi:hypothetical protein